MPSRYLLPLLLLGIESSLTAAPFANGGFETGGFAPWAVLGNAHVTHYMAAHNGVYFCAFNDRQASPNGVVSQSFTTIPKAIYTLTFWQGAEAYNRSATQSIKVAITGGNGSTLASAQYSVSVTGGTTKRVNWVQRTLVFTANSTATTLRFRDVGTNPTYNTDLLLDQVAVVAKPIPTPSPSATPTPPRPTPTPTPVATPTPTPLPSATPSPTPVPTLTPTPTPTPTASPTPVLPVTLAWDPPTTPVSGYRVLYWLASDGKILFVNSGAPTYLTFFSLSSGVWEFVVCGTGADQSAGCTTPPSNEVRLIVP